MIGGQSRRSIVLAVAFAVWGLAIAISLSSVWSRPAPAGQTPGFNTSANLDARGPFRWVAGMMILPLLVTVLLRPVQHRLSAETARPWAGIAVMGAVLLALWYVSISRDPVLTIAIPAVMTAVAVILRERDLAFEPADVVLLPVTLTTYLALNDLLPAMSVDRLAVFAIALVFALRVSVGLFVSTIPPAFAFVAAPLAVVLQTGYFPPEVRYSPWVPLAIITITPFVLRVLWPTQDRAAAWLKWVVYPLFTVCYLHATSFETGEGMKRANVFEDSHALMPASEYLAGERPYADVLPAHGLFEDGLFDAIAMQLFGVNAGAASTARVIVVTLSGAALYALGVAATGSVGAGFLTFLMTVMTGFMPGSIRPLPALIALVFVCEAVRRREWRLLRYAGFFCVISGLTSLDYAAYTFLTLVVAVIYAGADRRAAFRDSVKGIAAALLPFVLVMAALGIFDDFVRSTFVEIPSFRSAYTLQMFVPSEALRHRSTFPEVLGVVADRYAFAFLLWCAAAVFVAVMFNRARRPEIEPPLLIALWIVLSAISYAERRHLNFAIVGSVLFVSVVTLLLRNRNRGPAASLIVWAVIVAAPTAHIAITASVRDFRGPEKGWAPLDEPPRARGVLFRSEDAADIASVGKYVQLSLRPGETFFDFTNRGYFHFLFRRDYPVRQYETAFYQTEKRQREVIDRLERDHRVVAALVPGPVGRYGVDGVPNAARAPLVWEYLRHNFHPDFQEGDVVFWRRNVIRREGETLTP